MTRNHRLITVLIFITITFIEDYSTSRHLISNGRDGEDIENENFLKIRNWGWCHQIRIVNHHFVIISELFLDRNKKY